MSRPALTIERPIRRPNAFTSAGSVPASAPRPPAADSRSLSCDGTSNTDTESIVPPATSTAWRTSDSTLLGSEPVATIETRCPASTFWATVGKTEVITLSRWLSSECASRASERAFTTSLWSDELSPLPASETSESPIVAPSRMPIASARKTATSDSAW